MLRLEFHCHTIYSKDCLVKPETLVETCRRKGIQRVVVTDHNTTAGAVRARELAPELVIVGEEIMTQEGELLAAYINEEIPPGLPALEVIHLLREQGAFISVSHPFDQYRNGHWQEENLKIIAPLVDAIEVFNARCMQASFNDQAQAFAQRHNLLGTAGSDAHSAFELGRASMLLPDFRDAVSLKQAMAQVEYRVRLSSPLVHFTSRYAVWRKKMSPRIATNLDE
ncbi:MAG: PHP domain-containing protein [Anaerolineales bacterium]